MPLHRTHTGQIECACLRCGQAFFKFPSEIAKGEDKFCSRACYRAQQPIPRADRFWAKVNQLGPEHPTLGRCWLWTGARKGGKWTYGILGSRAIRVAPEAAHRVSWELHYGPIPDGANVLHRCDNPPCVNPQHLFLGTLKDNTRDMLQKGRHKEKLSPAQIAELNRRYRAGNISQTTLAAEYGVGQNTVSRKLREYR